MAKTKDLVPTSRPWSYEAAVTTGEKLVGMYNRISLDLVREIYAARQALSQPGFRSDRTSSQMGRGSNTVLHTYEEYLEAIGLPRSTAHRWLLFYEPETDKLLTPEEFKAKKIAEFEGLIKKLDPKRPAWRPDGWTDACERYYQEKLKQPLLNEIAQRDSFEQLDLFNEAYFKTLTAPIASNEDIQNFNRIADRITPIAYPGIPVGKQARAVFYIERMLSDFPPEDRAGIAQTIAQATILITQEE